MGFLCSDLYFLCCSGQASITTQLRSNMLIETDDLCAPACVHVFVCVFCTTSLYIVS
jgi:hypothetical protein